MNPLKPTSWDDDKETPIKEQFWLIGGVSCEHGGFGG
jgi:hypothetical protein